MNFVRGLQLIVLYNVNFLVLIIVPWLCMMLTLGATGWGVYKSCSVYADFLLNLKFVLNLKFWNKYCRLLRQPAWGFRFQSVRPGIRLFITMSLSLLFCKVGATVYLQPKVQYMIKEVIHLKCWVRVYLWSLLCSCQRKDSCDLTGFSQQHHERDCIVTKFYRGFQAKCFVQGHLA